MIKIKNEIHKINFKYLSEFISKLRQVGIDLYIPKL
jgi:hypothetical protein